MEIKVTLFNKIQTLIGLFLKVNLIKGFKQKILTFLVPLDAVRFYEIPYLLNFLSKTKLKNLNILDVSSPHQMAMLLNRDGNKLTRINPDPREEFILNKSDGISFEDGDATKLRFTNSQFDLVYSISVIEHIYEDYLLAVSEMIRVLKPGGHLYLSFPVGRKYSEVWLDCRDYPSQIEKNGKYFFQYNFDFEEIMEKFNSLGSIEEVSKSCFWEIEEDNFSAMIDGVKKTFSSKIYRLLNRSIANYYWGFNLFSDTSSITELGNISVIFKKIEKE